MNKFQLLHSILKKHQCAICNGHGFGYSGVSCLFCDGSGFSNYEVPYMFFDKSTTINIVLNSLYEEYKS